MSPVMMNVSYGPIAASSWLWITVVSSALGRALLKSLRPEEGLGGQEQEQEGCGCVVGGQGAARGELLVLEARHEASDRGVDGRRGERAGVGVGAHLRQLALPAQHRARRGRAGSSASASSREGGSVGAEQQQQAQRAEDSHGHHRSGWIHAVAASFALLPLPLPSTRVPPATAGD